MGTEPELNREAKEAIRGYLLKLVALPGIGGAIVIFLAGFFVRDVAIKRAEYEAFNRVSDTTIKLAEDAQNTRTVIDAVDADTKRHVGVIERLESEREAFANRLQAMDQQLDRTESQLANLLKNPEQTLNALEALDKYPNARQLAANFNQLNRFVAGIPPIDHGILKLAIPRDYSIAETSYDVKFNRSFDESPTVFLSPTDAANFHWGISNVTRDGFSVMFTTFTSNLRFQTDGTVYWAAIGDKSQHTLSEQPQQPRATDDSVTPDATSTTE